MAGNSDVQGLEAIQRVLQGYPEALKFKVLEGGMLAVAKAMVEPLQQAAPEKSGRLWRSIVARKTSFRSNAIRSKATGILEVASVVAIDAPGKRYWHFSEFGTSKLPARPWARPTFAREQGRLVEVLRTYIKKRAVREARKLAAIAKAKESRRG